MPRYCYTKLCSDDEISRIDSFYCPGTGTQNYVLMMKIFRIDLLYCPGTGTQNHVLMMMKMSRIDSFYRLFLPFKSMPHFQIYKLDVQVLLMLAVTNQRLLAFPDRKASMLGLKITISMGLFLKSSQKFRPWKLDLLLNLLENCSFVQR